MNPPYRFLPRAIFVRALLIGLSAIALVASSSASHDVEPGHKATVQQLHPLPAEDTCQAVSFYHPASDKLPLPLYLCYHSRAGFNTLAAGAAHDKNWHPEKKHYQGLADNLLDSRLASVALATGQRWYSMLDSGQEPRLPVVQLTELISPYFGCVLQVSEQGFKDPCTSANWDKLGRLLAPVADLPDQNLRQFPFVRNQQQVLLGATDPTLNWQYMSFKPDLHDAAVPLLTRLGKGLFWGMLDEVKTLWPEVEAMGELSETQQSQLFINAVAKQQTAAVRWLVAQGLNPMASNEYGDNALSVAKMIESEAMQRLLAELSQAQQQP